MLQKKNRKNSWGFVEFLQRLNCPLKNVKIYSRHDGRDGEELGHQIGKVAVHEYEEGFDFSDLRGEPCGEGCHKAKQNAEAHPT